MPEQSGGETAQVDVPEERVDRVIHTLEDLATGATAEQQRDIQLIHDQLMEAEA